MAIRFLKSSSSGDAQLAVRRFILDSSADAANLPTQGTAKPVVGLEHVMEMRAQTGSSAMTRDGTFIVILESDGAWREWFGGGDGV